MSPNGTWLKDFLRLLVQQGPVPKHVGFIMDGNRRYGKEHAIPLAKAYRIGAQTLENILEFCFATGIQTVTVYAFSLANFQRSAEEIKAVMGHVKVCLSRLLQAGGLAERSGVRLRVCGDMSLLPAETLEDLEHAERILAKNTKHVVNVCLAYGSRHEMASSVKAAVVKHSRQLSAAGLFPSPSGNGEQQGRLGVPLSRHAVIETLEDEMLTAGCPPLDILIRTSGTARLSDFMLWQCHQTTDIVILKKHWPELKYWDLIRVLDRWQRRAPRAKCIGPVRDTPDGLHIIMGWLYLVFQLLLIASNAVCRWSHAIDTELDCRLHGEVSHQVIQKDSGKLRKLPAHLSIILPLTEGPDALDIAMSTVADIMVWCSCMGIPLLSVYERTGVLKANKVSIHEMAATRLPLYYGAQRHTINPFGSKIGQPEPTKLSSLLLLSVHDGRESLADVCNALTDLVEREKLSPESIDTTHVNRMLQDMLLTSLDNNSSPKASLSDAGELMRDPHKGAQSNINTLSQCIMDPDVLLIFGPRIQFDGYPPWQLASPEIFCTGEDSAIFARRALSARYRLFLQSLQEFAAADIKLGR